MTEAPRAFLPPALPREEAEALARRFGLSPLGVRPPFAAYLRALWDRRSFLLTLSRAESATRHQSNRLGWVWTIVNPLLLIGSYYLIFGLLLSTNMGASNRVTFLAVGVIIFSVMASVISIGSKSLVVNQGLIRSLRFPRALLPLSVAVAEIIANLPAFAVLMVVLIATGSTPTPKWLLFPVAVLLMSLFLTGLTFITSRAVHAFRDLTNFIPLALRVLRYTSGVFFAIDHYTRHHPSLNVVMNYQPFALAMTTVRQSLLNDSAHQIVPAYWLAMTAWGVGIFVIGLVVFWHGESRYGRA